MAEIFPKGHLVYQAAGWKYWHWVPMIVQNRGDLFREKWPWYICNGEMPGIWWPDIPPASVGRTQGWSQNRIYYWGCQNHQRELSVSARGGKGLGGLQIDQNRENACHYLGEQQQFLERMYGYPYDRLTLDVTECQRRIQPSPHDWRLGRTQIKFNSNSNWIQLKVNSKIEGREEVQNWIWIWAVSTPWELCWSIDG